MACIISCLEGQEPAERFGCNGFRYGLKAGGAQIFGLHNQGSVILAKQEEKQQPKS